MSRNSPEEVLRMNVREVMKTLQGREFVWAILELCGVYTPGFTNDNNLNNHLSGKRTIGLEIIAMLQDADPTLYPKMLLDNIEEENNDT